MNLGAAHIQPHEFEENIEDPSMCDCGIPVFNHDSVERPAPTTPQSSTNDPRELAAALQVPKPEKVDPRLSDLFEGLDI
jgi:hypothetical protein